jgi:hypothetical protein
MEKELVIENFENYNQCEMIIKVTFPDYPIIKTGDDYKNKTIVIGGYGHLINREISKQLNYTFVYKIYDDRNKSYSF